MTHRPMSTVSSTEEAEAWSQRRDAWEPGYPQHTSSPWAPGPPAYPPHLATIMTGFLNLAEGGECPASSLRTEQRLAHFHGKATFRQQPQDPLILKHQLLSVARASVGAGGRER